MAGCLVSLSRVHAIPIMATVSQKGSFLRQATVNVTHNEEPEAA
jgi:hypothetical protein